MGTSGKGLVERAYELAGSGDCETLTDVAKRLKVEGYALGDIEQTMEGLKLRTQLSSLCREAYAKARVQSD